MGNDSEGELTVGHETCFPLHLYNAPRSILQEVARRLSACKTSQAGWGGLIPLLIKHDIRCREVDTYVQENRPKFMMALQSIPGRPDDEDYENERVEEALKALDVLPDVEVQDLFDSFGSDVRKARQLFENAEESLIGMTSDALNRLASKEGKILSVEKHEAVWQAFRFIGEARLTIRDEEIPIAERLATLKVQELQGIAGSLGIKLPSRKPAMIEVLASHSGTSAALAQVCANRTFVKAPPDDSEQATLVELVCLLLGQAFLMSEIIGRTYESASSNASRGDFSLDDDGFIVGWEIAIVDDTRCCRFCRKAAKLRYPYRQPPKVPLHLVCRCVLSPITRLENR